MTKEKAPSLDRTVIKFFIQFLIEFGHYNLKLFLKFRMCKRKTFKT